MSNFIYVEISVENAIPISDVKIALRPLTVCVGLNHKGQSHLATLIYALHGVSDGFADVLREPQKCLSADFKRGMEAELLRCFSSMSISSLIPSTENTPMTVRLKVGHAATTAYWRFGMQAIDGRICITEFAFSVNAPSVRFPKKLPQLKEAARRCYFLPAGREGIRQCRLYSALPSVIPLNPPWISGVIVDYIAGNMETPSSIYRRGLTPGIQRRGVATAGDMLIIEAPEEGLHPGDQVNMALTLASFVRAGVRVIITTHSDWLLKAIANLMRLGELKQKGERGESGDIQASWLLPEEVGVWWFQKDEIVQPIPFTRDEGIEPPDYEEVADALYNRSVHLQDRLEAVDRQAQPKNRGS